MHDVYIYALDEKQREWYIDRSDEFLGCWTLVFVKRA